MRRTKEDAEITRREILKAALNSFTEKGYSATRLEDVAKLAGVTRGAIYWHFDNKEHLYLQLMEETIDKYKTRVREVLDKEGSPLTKIRTLLRELFVMLEDDEEYRAAYASFLLRTEMTERMRRQFDGSMEFMIELGGILGNLVSEGIRIEEIEPGTDPYVAAVALITFINGVEMSWLMDPTSFSVKELAENLSDFALHGIAKN